MRPRTWGLSLSSRTSLSLLRPSAFTARRWRAWVPRRPRTRRTLTGLFDSLAIEESLRLLAALGRNTLRRLHGLQTPEGGADQVDRVARTDGLGQHVLHAHRFQDGTHGAAGDHAGTFRGRLHEHARGAVTGLDRMPQGALVEIDAEHALARILHRLLDGHRDLTGLAVAEADLAVTIAHHGQRGEGELAAALDGLADAVDRDQLLDHAIVDLFFAVAVATARLTLFCHFEFLGLSGYVRLGPLMVVGCRGEASRPRRRRTAPGATCAGRPGPPQRARGNQNCRPASRAASASALMRPW